MLQWGTAMFGRGSTDGGKGLPPPPPAAAPSADSGLSIDVEDVTPETPGLKRTGSGGWLSPTKSTPRKRATPRKGEVKQALYEPPVLEKALARMRRLQPHMETDDPEKPTKKLNIWMKEEEMQGKFSEGIVFWFKLMRDHLLLFFIFMVLSFWAFNQMRVSNDENNTSYDRLGALGRVTLAAIMLWSEDTQRKGEQVSNTDKDATLGIIVLDALMMFALLFVTGWHHMKKEQVKEEVDDATISLDDYSIVIESGLPTDVTEERIRAHFEKYGEVHEVALGKDLLEVMNLRKSLIALEANHEMLEWMLKRANKLLGIEEMDTSNMSKEDIANARWKKLTRKVKKEIDKREGRRDIFFAALEQARDDSLSIEDRAAAAANAAAKNPRFAGGKDNAGAAASKDPSNYNPAMIKEKINKSLKDREELEDEIAACVEEGYPVITAWVAFEEEDSCVECVKAVRASKKHERKMKAKKLVGIDEHDGLPGGVRRSQARRRSHPGDQNRAASFRHPLGEPPLLHGHLLEARAPLQLDHVGFPHHQRVRDRGREDHLRHPPTQDPGVRGGSGGRPLHAVPRPLEPRLGRRGRRGAGQAGHHALRQTGEERVRLR